MGGRSERTALVYVGTLTGDRSEGIHCYRMDPSSGALRPLEGASGVINPAFLAVDRQRRLLYAVNEVDVFEGQASGAVSAFRIEPETGVLTLINQQPSHGAGPCHLTIDPSGRFVLVANYGGGSVAVFPVQPDGSLGEVSDVVQHRGAGVDPQRQEAPHCHSVTVGPDGRTVFVADLGLDKVMIYRLDPERGKLLAGDPPWLALHAGAGPRHMDLHPSGRYAYVVNELDSTLTACVYDGAHGALEVIQTVSTLPRGFEGENWCADIHVAPSGLHVYASNRGHDSIAIYAVDTRTGLLCFVGHEATRGRTPRNFAVSPTGLSLLVANQESHTIVAFRVDPETGHLASIGQVAEVQSPVCVKIVPVG
ncbi:MAG: lactonase family protein [Anaerolineales bacterium]|nr:lactonase family protein [Anaerolineales bacterium]